VNGTVKAEFKDNKGREANKRRVSQVVGRSIDKGVPVLFFDLKTLPRPSRSEILGGPQDNFG